MTKGEGLGALACHEIATPSARNDKGRVARKAKEERLTAMMATSSPGSSSWSYQI